MTEIQIILKIRLYSMENSLKTHNFKKCKGIIPYNNIQHGILLHNFKIH